MPIISTGQRNNGRVVRRAMVSGQRVRVTSPPGGRLAWCNVVNRSRPPGCIFRSVPPARRRSPRLEQSASASAPASPRLVRVFTHYSESASVASQSVFLFDLYSDQTRISPLPFGTQPGRNATHPTPLCHVESVRGASEEYSFRFPMNPNSNFENSVTTL
uniref:Uncharacterized protein n=1 Tax=Plectus sambesii TaxID=2011161 RepID=A0A914V0H6_9BILA